LLDIFLKPNGFFFLSTPNIGSFWVRTLKKRWHGFGIPEYHITYFTAQTLKALFDSLNYLPVVERTINPFWSHFFLLRNLAAAIADEYLQTQVKVIKASICAICLLPEKVAELVMPHLGMADTLIGCYRKVK
jgi:hypothetical protein